MNEDSKAFELGVVEETDEGVRLHLAIDSSQNDEAIKRQIKETILLLMAEDNGIHN